jgi:hypothetical protein
MAEPPRQGTVMIGDSPGHLGTLRTAKHTEATLLTMFSRGTLQLLAEANIRPSGPE